MTYRDFPTSLILNLFIILSLALIDCWCSSQLVISCYIIVISLQLTHRQP